MHKSLLAESKFVHQVFFRCVNSRPVVFNCEDIPTGALNPRARNCFGKGKVFVEAAAGVSTLGPACCVVKAVRCGFGCGAHRVGSERFPRTSIMRWVSTQPIPIPNVPKKLTYGHLGAARPSAKRKARPTYQAVNPKTRRAWKCRLQRSFRVIVRKEFRA